MNLVVQSSVNAINLKDIINKTYNYVDDNASTIDSNECLFCKVQFHSVPYTVLLQSHTYHEKQLNAFYVFMTFACYHLSRIFYKSRTIIMAYNWLGFMNLLPSLFTIIDLITIGHSPLENCTEEVKIVYRAMSGQRSKSALYEVVYPAYFILRLFGQAPYAYPKKNEPPRLQPSWSYCTYNLIWFLVYSCNLALVIVRTANLGHKPIIAVTEMGKPIFNYVVLMIDMAMEIVKREQLVDVWNSISEFDETYQLSRTVEGKPGKYGPVLAKTKRRLWFFFSISIVGWTAVNQMSRLAYETSHLQNFCYDLSYFGTYIAGFKFSGVVFLLGQRFGYLNEVMTKMTMDKIQRYTCFNIEKIQAEYYQLISASEKLNEIYFWLLLLIISNLFWHMITTMYFFMSFVMTRPRIACAEPTWFMMFLIQLFLICVTCDYTSQEWWCKPSLHLPYRKLHFSAAGFFNVDLQLLTAIFGLMTTYLVILLQF